MESDLEEGEVLESDDEEEGRTKVGHSGMSACPHCDAYGFLLLLIVCFAFSLLVVATDIQLTEGPGAAAF